MAQSTKINRLARELTSVRRRGLDQLELDTPGQPRTVIPILEGLARAHTGAEGLRRIELIRRLMQDGLDAYQGRGTVAEAELIRRLFFDDGTGQTLSRVSPGKLLASAISDSGLSSDTFAIRRRAAFKDFADFLLGFVVQPIEADEPPDESPDQAPGDETSEIEPKDVPKTADEKTKEIMKGVLVVCIAFFGFVGILLLLFLLVIHLPGQHGGATPPR